MKSKKKHKSIKLTRYYCGWCYCGAEHCMRLKDGGFSCGKKECNKNHINYTRYL